MNTDDVILDSRVMRVRELKSALDAARRELAETKTLLAEYESHFALALLAVRDADAIGKGGRVLLVDGWNVLLGARSGGKAAGLKSPADLIAFTRSAVRAASVPTFAWLVFDGKDENAVAEPNLRVSYTGGTGMHRADRLMLDYLRMRRLAGAAAGAGVVTDDADFSRRARALGAEVVPPKDFLNQTKEQNDER